MLASGRLAFYFFEAKDHLLCRPVAKPISFRALRGFWDTLPRIFQNAFLG
jgi:hypothetical protein